MTKTLRRVESIDDQKNVPLLDYAKKKSWEQLEKGIGRFLISLEMEFFSKVTTKCMRC